MRIRVSDDEVVEVGVRMTLSFHDRSPAVQVTLTDLRTRVALIREQMRATLAEESNNLLKEEIKRHKATQMRLADAERLNRSIIESSIDMIVAFNEEGELTQYNQAFAVEFGLEFGEEAETYKFRNFRGHQIGGRPDSKPGLRELQFFWRNPRQTVEWGCLPHVLDGGFVAG